MEHAKIAIFEDDELARQLLAELLEYSGHEVVAKAGSFEESVKVVEALEPGAVDVVLLDGNLTEGRNDSREGSQIAQALRAKFTEEFRIVNISASDSPILGADVNIPKYDSGEIRNYISEL